MKGSFFVIDISTKEISGTIFSLSDYQEVRKNKFNDGLKGLNNKTDRQPMVFSKVQRVRNLIYLINQLLDKLNIDKQSLCGIGISINSIVSSNINGTNCAGNCTNFPQKATWEKELINYYACRVIILEHIEALTIGMAELGFLFGNKVIGIITIGFTSGLFIWRNGRKWMSDNSDLYPCNVYRLIRFYNEMNTANRVSLPKTNTELFELFRNSQNNNFRKLYAKSLGEFVTTVTELYHLDEIYLSGELIDADEIFHYNFYNTLQPILSLLSNELNKSVTLKIIAKEGYDLRIRGIAAMIVGEAMVCAKIKIPQYDALETEQPCDERLMLHQKTSDEIVEFLWEEEEKAGKNLKKSLSVIAATAKKMSQALSDNGRIIYIGAGTSGRIAAMDAIEIPCTFGLPKDKILAIIAGRVMNASIEIESGFEEDKSSIEDMLLLNINDKDVVIGISASGSAHFVQSALAFAKFRGGYTVMIQNTDSVSALSFCHTVIPLHSGFEVIAGSTRMKAGTSTKKMLNFLSSTAMIILGNVYGPYMINLTCINNKLKSRAESILCKLFNLSSEDSRKILEDNNYNLKKTCSLVLSDKGKKL